MNFFHLLNMVLVKKQIEDIKMEDKILIIVRGIPGCGKSTFAKLLTNEEAICTADEFMMVDGVYKFRVEKLARAHAKCKEKCEALMSMAQPKIVVANTSTTNRETKPYHDLAVKYGYKVFSIIVENKHGGIDEHNVPKETLDKMKLRFNITL